VIPGNIIFRQRGTHWYPGENCKFGRDHCIFAMETGYVRYYRDPLKHPDRQYIGVALNKNDTLPYPRNATRKRRLGMVAVVKETAPDAQAAVAEQIPTADNAGLRAESYKALTAGLNTRGAYAFGDISYIGRTNGVCVIFLKRELTLSFFGICLLVCSQLMGVVMSRILLYICT
jgi:large subunit ribosomal protein L27